MRRTRLSSKRSQDGCQLLSDLHLARIIISKLPQSDKASLALTCSLAATTVHSEVTALDFSRASTSGSTRTTSSNASMAMAKSIRRSTQLLQRCLRDARWSRLEALVLPVTFHPGICSAAAVVAMQWPKLHTLALLGGSWWDPQPESSPTLTSSPGLLAPWWTQLRSLYIQTVQIDAHAAQQLAQAGLDSMHTLRLCSNSLEDDGLKRLLGARWPRLASLTVRINDLTEAGMRHLAAATQLTALRSLGLQDNNLYAGAVQVLAGATHLQLTALDLSGNQVDDEGLEQLMVAKQLVSSLRSLAINDTGIMNLVPLATATQLSNLTSLEAIDNDELCCLGLASATHLSTLQHVRLGHSDHVYGFSCIASHGTEALSKLLLSHLTSFVLEHVRLDHADHMSTLAAANFPSLCSLHLADAAMTKETMLELAKAQWPQLQQLDLRGNKHLTTAALMELWRMRRSCPALRSLVVPAGVHAAAVQARLAKGPWMELVVKEHVERCLIDMTD